MTNQETIKLLLRTGHLCFPFGEQQEVPKETPDLPLIHPVVERALASYHDFMMEDLDRLCLQHHGRPARANGVSGPATVDLLNLPRCGHPDYGEEVQPVNVQAAIGTGSWKGCHGVGNYHAATCYVDKRNMPSFWGPIFDKVWERSVAAYAEIGLRWSLVDDRQVANTTLAFELGRKPWIGLAIVGQSQSCSSQIWLKLLASYQPDQLVEMLTELLMHELGHNASLQHSRGGIMNPSIVHGLPATWIGDPSESILKRLYGGVPIPDGRADEHWIKQCFESNRGRKVCVPLIPPIKYGDDIG